MYSNSTCSCLFEVEIINIGQSSHKMSSNNTEFSRVYNNFKYLYKKVCKLIDFTTFFFFFLFSVISQGFDILLFSYFISLILLNVGFSWSLPNVYYHYFSFSSSSFLYFLNIEHLSDILFYFILFLIPLHLYHFFLWFLSSISRDFVAFSIIAFFIFFLLYLWISVSFLNTTLQFSFLILSVLFECFWFRFLFL